MSDIEQVHPEVAAASRSTLARVLEFWSRVRGHVWRAVYLLGVLAFLLPFATVKGCGAGDITDYRGFELIVEDFTGFGWVFLLPICIGLAFLGLSFVRRQRGQILQGFFRSWRVVFASLAALIVLMGPVIYFLFDKITPRIGYIIGGTCWSLVFLGSLVGAFVHLWRVVHSRASPACRASWGIVLSRALHYLLAVYVFVHPLLYPIRADELLWLLTWLFFLSIPAFLVLYLGAEGIRNGERWAIVWGAFLSFCLMTGCIVVCAYAIKDNALITLIVSAAIACFAAVVFAGSLSTLRGFARARTPV